jgi:hypothetical protein
MKRIYNTITGKTIWRGLEYQVDGQPATVDAPLFILDEVERTAPEYDSATQRLSSVPAHADIEAGEWVLRSYEVVALSADELAANARKTWPNAAAFLNEFTMPELSAISLSLDPTIAALRLLLASWAADVWSDDPRIVMGLDALETAGIIDETRLAAIVAKV